MLACEAMVIFKRVSSRPARWSQAPRLPSKALYERAEVPVDSLETIRRREQFSTLEKIQAQIAAAFAEED